MSTLLLEPPVVAPKRKVIEMARTAARGLEKCVECGFLIERGGTCDCRQWQMESEDAR